MANTAQRGALPEPGTIKSALNCVVQVVALRRGFLGNSSSAWTGSGTIVDKRGIVLTNCHVANPRAMGMPSPPADALAIAITSRSDEPPALTYLAEIVVQSPELDLAVLKIVSDVNGRKVRNLDLPFVPVGDSDKLELGDNLAIFGYPGIGGETITFTSGSVAGFTSQRNVTARRAWIKTDATIAGGNSGGTAINHDGLLVGIPTQAAAGDKITPVDARPVVDTNRDGRVDQRDTPMAIGGFINGLRPANLAKPLLKQAGVKVKGAGSRMTVPMEKKETTSSSTSKKKKSSGTKTRTTANFSNLVFSARMSRSGKPINPSAILRKGSRQIFATFEHAAMRKNTAWGMTWTVNGQVIVDEKLKWDGPAKGVKTISVANSPALPEGEYHLILTIRNKVALEGTVVVGRRVDDSDSEISGQVVDQRTGRGVKEALVIALKPGIRVMDFVRQQRQDMAYTSVKTNRKGEFTFKKQLPKGQAYGLVVVARGYNDLVVESGLRVGARSPERANMGAIPMTAE